MCGKSAIDIDAQSLALMVTVPVSVPRDGEVMAFVTYVVEAEIVPRIFGYERIDFYPFVGAWTQPDESGDDQVVECRVVVVSAAFLFSFEPVTGDFVEILSDIGTAVEIMRLCI